jgi:hypothetical protein
VIGLNQPKAFQRLLCRQGLDLCSSSSPAIKRIQRRKGV